MSILKAGLVGCGSLSQRGVLPHLSLADAREKVQLAAVVDVDEERARQSAARYDVPASFTSVEAMLEQADVDLVLVITPIPYHYPVAMAAMQAGKHVYIQKAMTTSLAEADAVIATRDQMGVKLAAAPGFELFVTTQRMREAIVDDAIGRVSIAHTYTMGFGHEFEPIRNEEGVLAAIDPTWYYRPGGGPLPDVTIYALQLITSLLGSVKRVTALANKTAPERTWQGKTIPVEVDDNSLVLMEFENGAIATAVGSNCAGSPRIPWGGLSVFGTDGALDVIDVDPYSGYPLEFEISGKNPQRFRAELVEQPYIRGRHLEIEEPHVYADIMDLVDAIRDDRPTRAPGEQARHVVEIIEKSYAAVSSGQTQTLTSTI
jgi:predicted dehydrogenase